MKKDKSLKFNTKNLSNRVFKSNPKMSNTKFTDYGPIAVKALKRMKNP